MKTNFGYLFAKLIKRIYCPALKNCEMGEDTRVGSESNCINMQLGRHSYLGKACTVQNVKIGTFSSVSHNCSLGGCRHEMAYVSTSPVFCRGGHTSLKRLGHLPEVEQPFTTIGNDVWIGEKCFIKAGISIGDGAVVGAHSVVTHDVPAYAIVAGCPARILRYRFDDQTIESLLRIKWWEWDDEKIKRNSALFETPQKLIEAYNGGQVK